MFHAMAEATGEHPVVLFDGVCNVCNGGVNFIIDRDPGGTFRFAALQSEAARKIFGQVGRTIPSGDPESIVVFDGGRLLERSTAMLRIVRDMRGAWPLLGILRVVPRPLRDALYSWFAARRYRWFGKTDTCRVPSPEIRGRFLD
jgi:predicted DCC family thiol-disulfide oxidoreductase YuxK